ncbi:MAG TPA: ferritin [Bacteroidales bacterium]|nr:ferritin [Bacteroidales bacterium]
MINKNVETALNRQIKHEEHSSRLYLAMASWCEANSYLGSAKFLFRQSEEERMHQLKLIHYLNSRGGYAILADLPKIENEFKSLKEIFEKVLAHEQFITSSINEIYEIAQKEKDYNTAAFLQWYINEQVEEENTANSILDMFKLLGKSDNYFMLDKELGAMGSVPLQ